MNPQITHHFPAVTYSALTRELRRERQFRERVYVSRIAKGNMLQAEATRELALIDALAEDVSRIERCWHTAPGSPLAPPAHGFTWSQRRGALLRELALRDKHYPEWIRDGRLLETDAVYRIACLQCLLELYEDGLDWRGADGTAKRWSGHPGRTREERNAEVEWHQFQLARALEHDLPIIEASARRGLAAEGVHPAAVGGQKEMAL